MCVCVCVCMCMRCVWCMVNVRSCVFVRMYATYLFVFCVYICMSHMCMCVCVCVGGRVYVTCRSSDVYRDSSDVAGVSLPCNACVKMY